MSAKFGCAKAFDDEMECDVYGKPTKVRVARIGKNEKYKARVDDSRKEKKMTALDYSPSRLCPFTWDLAMICPTRHTRRSSSRFSMMRTTARPSFRYSSAR